MRTSDTDRCLLLFYFSRYSPSTVTHFASLCTSFRIPSAYFFGLMSQPVAHGRSISPCISSSSAPLRPSLKELAYLYTSFSAETCGHHKYLIFSYEFQLVCTVQQTKKLITDGCSILEHASWSIIFVNRQNSQDFLFTLENKIHVKEK